LIRERAVAVLARTWPQVATVRDCLRNALRDGDAEVRSAALGGLLRIETDGNTTIILSRDLDGQALFLDPGKAIPPRHREAAAARLGVSAGEMERILSEASRLLGWDLRKGLDPAPEG
jgi:hypothetical protein